MEMSDLKVLIVGGGTGGHISPGIALFEALTDKGIDAWFLAGKNDRKFAYINEIGDRLMYYGAPAFTTNIVRLPFFLLRFAFAVLRSMRILRRLEINTVVGMGGYVSAPMLLAARIKKVPIDLCEQNSVPGRVTRLFSKYAHNIFSTFETTREYLKYKHRFSYAGNPIRKNVFSKVSREKAREFYNMKHCSHVILAIGGSQGAVKINELIFGIKKLFPREFKNVGIIWSTGALSFEEYKKRVHEEINEGSVFLSPLSTRWDRLRQRPCHQQVGRGGDDGARGDGSAVNPHPVPVRRGRPPDEKRGGVRREGSGRLDIQRRGHPGEDRPDDHRSSQQQSAAGQDVEIGHSRREEGFCCRDS
jgi:hypothetical protein